MNPAEYKQTLAEYKLLLNQVNESRNDQAKRTKRNNPYLNNTIRFSTGQYAYVTKQGVVKYLNSDQPAPAKYIDVQIPWDPTYETPNTPIRTNPPLISGTPMVKGQSVGYEGENVYVDRVLSAANAVYQGCYSDNKTMKFLNDAVPSANSPIVNGNFTQPQLAPNTFAKGESIVGWTCSRQTLPPVGTIGNASLNSVLLNNDSEKLNYPKINGQSVAIQNAAYISQTIYELPSGKHTLTFKMCGRAGGANPIELVVNKNTVASFDPPINVWTAYTQSITIDVAGTNIVAFRGTNTSGFKSSAICDVSLDGESATGAYTYDTCKQAAMDGGYKFFGLQSTGYCAVTNDAIAAMNDSTSYAVSSTMELWSSQTVGDEKSYATLSSNGSLSVVNNNPIYGTPVKNPTNYLGCYTDKYTDKEERAMSLHDSGKQLYTHDKCRDIAAAQNKRYYALQNANPSTGEGAQCALSDDLLQVRKYGIANNCVKVNEMWAGGAWSNAVYTMSPEEKGNYFLVLQDDHNMCVYRGSGPNDNQGVIWASDTVGKGRKPNPLYAAAKGKYTRNWIAAGDTLAANEFVGSNDGTIYLMMQPDGNLVLKTSTSEVNCKKESNYMTGGVGANAIYELDKVGDASLLGRYGYIDANGGIVNGKQGDSLNNVDSVQYKQYANHVDLPTTNVDEERLKEVEDKLNMYAAGMSKSTASMIERDKAIEKEMSANTQRIKEGFRSNSLVENSETVLMQRNYEYLLWSMLAITGVLMAIKFSRGQ